MGGLMDGEVASLFYDYLTTMLAKLMININKCLIRRDIFSDENYFYMLNENKNFPQANKHEPHAATHLRKPPTEKPQFKIQSNTFSTLLLNF